MENQDFLQERISTSSDHDIASSINDDSKIKSKRKAYNNKRQRLADQCLKIIDRKYKQRKEILPGIVVYSQPLAGEIKLNLTFQAELFYEALKRSFHNWAHSVGYMEVRSLKGLNGQTSSVDDLEAVDEIARRLIICIWVLINAEKTSIKLAVAKLLRNAFYAGWDKSLNKEFEFTCKHFGSWDMSFDKCYHHLGRFSAVGNFMQSKDEDIFDFSKKFSIHTLNTIKVESSWQSGIPMVLGENATEKDLCLACILMPEISENCLEKGQLYTYSYGIPSKTLINAIKRFILKEYVGTNEVFISPVTTSMDSAIVVEATEGIDTIV